MKCPACNHEWKLPGPQAGGRAKVKKGFAMGQPSAAARKRAWNTRKEKAKRSHNNAAGQTPAAQEEHHE
jgi:hypothetical protein